jgi:hypothetical protein
LPTTVSDSITLAIEHTKQQLFQPFRIGQWTKLALVGLLAGEVGGNGCNFRSPTYTGAAPHPGFPGSLGIEPALLVPLMAAVVIVAFGIAIVLMYVASVMRFILFDSIVTKKSVTSARDGDAGWVRDAGTSCGRCFICSSPWQASLC